MNNSLSNNKTKKIVNIVDKFFFHFNDKTTRNKIRKLIYHKCKEKCYFDSSVEVIKNHQLIMFCKNKKFTMTNINGPTILFENKGNN